MINLSKENNSHTGIEGLRRDNEFITLQQQRSTHTIPHRHMMADSHENTRPCSHCPEDKRSQSISGPVSYFALLSVKPRGEMCRQIVIVPATKASPCKRSVCVFIISMALFAAAFGVARVNPSKRHRCRR